MQASFLTPLYQVPRGIYYRIEHLLGHPDLLFHCGIQLLVVLLHHCEKSLLRLLRELRSRIGVLKLRRKFFELIFGNQLVHKKVVLYVLGNLCGEL